MIPAILWNFAYEVDGRLMWCCGSGSQNVHPVPVPVAGNLTEPFFLVSTKENDKITLRAVPTNYNQFVSPIVCKIEEKFLEDCRSGEKPGLMIITHVNETGSFEQEIRSALENYDDLMDYAMRHHGA